MKQQVKALVTGRLACFTRPEVKAEPITYKVITPSAARGVLEAIYWKPEFKYSITKISVLNWPTYVTIMQNGLKNKQSLRAGPISINEDRTQRTTTYLQDVGYILYADIVCDKEEDLFKHRSIFNRRILNGQCHHTPVLGLRECAARFGPVHDDIKPVPWTEDLGVVLYGIVYSSGKSPCTPIFYNPEVVNGSIEVPQLSIKVGKS